MVFNVFSFVSIPAPAKGATLIIRVLWID